MRFAIKFASSLLLVSALVGCGAPSGHEDAAAPAAPAAPAAVERAEENVAPDALQVTPELVAVLEFADAADGEVDHVVSQCTNCGLGMEGVADHATQVGDYALHFCSEGCLEDFSNNAEQRLMALNVPAVEIGANQVETP